MPVETLYHAVGLRMTHHSVVQLSAEQLGHGRPLGTEEMSAGTPKRASQWAVRARACRGRGVRKWNGLGPPCEMIHNGEQVGDTSGRR